VAKTGERRQRLPGRTKRAAEGSDKWHGLPLSRRALEGSKTAVGGALAHRHRRWTAVSSNGTLALQARVWRLAEAGWGASKTARSARVLSLCSLCEREKQGRCGSGSDQQRLGMHERPTRPRMACTNRWQKGGQWVALVWLLSRCRDPGFPGRRGVSEHREADAAGIGERGRCSTGGADKRGAPLAVCHTARTWARITSGSGQVNGSGLWGKK
jgi:hypothetical protein